jgi:pilus assembly protein CpaB
MRLTTIASLGASAALGLAALFVAKVALPASAADKPVAAVLPQPHTVPVVVAAQAISFGERLEARQLAVARYPADALPAGAFSSIDQVLAQDGGGAPVALTPLAQREPILPAKISGPGARASVAAEIAEGMRAYTIRVSDVSGVGGHALPGDRVDVVLMRDTNAGGGGELEGAGGGRGKNLVSQVVIQNVRVLGVDLNADLTSNKPATPQTATLEVSVEDAQKLAVASDLGVLSLALRRTGAAEIAPVRPMQTRDFVGAPRPAAAAAAPRARRTGPAAPRQAPLITVVEGDGTAGGNGA